MSSQARRETLLCASERVLTHSQPREALNTGSVQIWSMHISPLPIGAPKICKRPGCSLRLSSIFSSSSRMMTRSTSLNTCSRQRLTLSSVGSRFTSYKAFIDILTFSIFSSASPSHTSHPGPSSSKLRTQANRTASSLGSSFPTTRSP